MCYVIKITKWEAKECQVADTACQSALQQSFSTLALMAFWTRQFFVVGAILGIVGYLAGALASTH